jgi:hypothetical protein
MISNLRKLKQDRDTCYALASAAYGQEFVNELLWEGDEIDEESTNRINEMRKTLKPIELPQLVAKESAERETAKSFHRGASITDDEWYRQ